ncbi:MAG: hypothetical protein OSB62_02845 [Alphaproteobacteria bacterium]|nr:hypothetical protein [Alphaproteobacteria bacterium]
MSKDSTQDLFFQVIKHIQEAAIGLYNNKPTVADINQQIARNALNELIKRQNSPYNEQEYEGNSETISFMVGSIMLVIETKDALIQHGDPDNHIPLCDDIIQDIQTLGTLIGFTLRIIEEDDDDE